MNQLNALYKLAEENGIDVDCVALSRATSLSVELPDGEYAIAMDMQKITSAADECVHLAHELGHCITGSFYNPYTPFDIRQKHENHADKWAIERLIHLDTFTAALDTGVDLKCMADIFGVTLTFIKKAVCWYANGNLAFESYGL